MLKVINFYTDVTHNTISVKNKVVQIDSRNQILLDSTENWGESILFNGIDSFSLDCAVYMNYQ